MANGYEHVGLLGIDDVFVKKDAVHVTDSLKSYMRQLRLPQFFLDKEDLELYFDTESITHDELWQLNRRGFLKIIPICILTYAGMKTSLTLTLALKTGFHAGRGRNADWINL